MEDFLALDTTDLLLECHIVKMDIALECNKDLILVLNTIIA
jgi:hypothetical protein